MDLQPLAFNPWHCIIVTGIVLGLWLLAFSPWHCLVYDHWLLAFYFGMANPYHYERHFMIMTMETHATATKDDRVMDVVIIANRVLLAYYTAECTVRVYIMKKDFFHFAWNNLDIMIVATGLISEALEVFKVGGSGMDQIAMLKSLRMLRLLRLVRLLVAFRELYVLVAGIGRCMKTLFWAAGLIFVVLNVWAILSVEFLDARVQELIKAGAYETCGWCKTAFTNVWFANLTWFQIISTADWTPIGRPLAEIYYWPYLIFVLNVFIVIWGLLNLIVAAIVDANLAAREDDVAIAAQFASNTHDAAWRSFEEICRAMDEDGSGDVSVDEFKKFVKDNVELQQHLTIMGVQDKDVEHLLQLMDEDDSGKLEHAEFIEEFTSMRTLVEKTTLYFLLKFVKNIQARIIQQREVIESMCTDMAELRRSLGNGTTRDSDYPLDETVPVPAALRTTANAAKAEISDVEWKTLPHGWYYFGTSLPHEAGGWCKEIDPSHGGAPSRKFQSDPKEATITAHSVATASLSPSHISAESQGWEPVPSNSVCFNFAKQDLSSKEASPQKSQARARPGPLQDLGNRDTVANSWQGHQPGQLDIVDPHVPVDMSVNDDDAPHRVSSTTVILIGTDDVDVGLREALAITPHACLGLPKFQL